MIPQLHEGKKITAVLLWLPTVFAAVPAILVCFLSVEIPIWDDYALMEPLWKLHTGHFQITDLFRQVAENRPVIPAAFLLGLVWWTNWHHAAVNFFNLCVLVVFSYVSCERLARRSSAPETVKFWTICLLCFLLFSPVGSGLWLDNWYLNNTLGALFALLACNFCSRQKWFFLIIGICFAFLATFSNTNCLALWPSIMVGLVLCWPGASFRRLSLWPWPQLGLWMMAGIATVALYIKDMNLTPSGGVEVPANSLVSVTSFTLQFLGAPFCNWHSKIAMAIGAIGVATAVLVFIYLRRNDISSAFIVQGCHYCLFAAAAAALTALGRNPSLNPGYHPFKSRYLVTAMLFWIGTAYLVHAIPPQFFRAYINRTIRGLLVLILMIGCLNWARGLKHTYGASCQREAIREKVLAGSAQRQDLICLYPQPEILLEMFEQLRQCCMSLYRRTNN